jgi:hypothetical protein
MLITKNQDLDLDAFLYCIIYPPIKEINKHYINNLVDTNDVKFSLNNFLDSNPIITNLKLHIFPSKNVIILDITFKFSAKFNM